MDTAIDIFRDAMDEAFAIFGDDDPRELVAVIKVASTSSRKTSSVKKSKLRQE